MSQTTKIINPHDQNYFDMVNFVLENGVSKPDRTGTGVTSTFIAPNYVYDLRKGFPILTTKKVHWPSIVHELLWFLSGNTNIKYLKENNVKIWDSWVDEYGTIGSGYGKQWRRWESIELVKISHIQKPDQKPVGKIAGMGTSDGADKSDPFYDMLFSVWCGILHRCYNDTREDYKYYGKEGIFVSDEWLYFKNFQKDAKKIPGWLLRVEFPNKYSLDKDMSGCNFYSKDTCKWSSNTEQAINTRRSKIITAISPSGSEFTILDFKYFCKNHDIDYSNAMKKLKGANVSTKGWRFSYKEIKDGYLPRIKLIDQIHDVIAQIKHNPTSRRIIVSAWNVSDLNNMQLPPCHSFFQFNVSADGQWLDLKLTQRSADAFIGIPFNIASYSLLLSMIAQITDKKPRYFIHSLGDLHIYDNHLEQVKEQLSRTHFEAPQLMLNPTIKNIDDFKFYHIALKGYEHHPAIKADVAV